jgi:hypothetical protein
MKLTRIFLVLLILACCAMLVLTTPSRTARADEGILLEVGGACDKCKSDKNSCLFSCGSNNQCRQNCENNYGFCIDINSCPPE